MKDVISFETINGKNIFTIFSESHPSSKNLVIMNHGFKGNSTGASRTFVNFSRLLISHGISALRFDQPNSGNSEGDFIDSSFGEWVDTTVYFAKKYLDQGYNVALLGHSMGANSALTATFRAEIRDKISCLLLWAPDPKSNPADWFIKESKRIIEKNNVYEETGQRFKASFWQEVKDADFFKCLNKYNGRIHLVYGENDKFVSSKLRDKVILEVRNKKQPVTILKGQDHVSWDYDVCEQVYYNELELLKNIFSLLQQTGLDRHAQPILFQGSNTVKNQFNLKQNLRIIYVP